MKKHIPFSRSGTWQFCAALALASACSVAGAERVADRAGESGRLTVGMRYVVPPYNAGAKFRTPEGMETALAEDVARRQGFALRAVAVNDEKPLLSQNRPDVVLMSIDDHSPLRNSATVVSSGYVSGAMAIMRTDTDIKSWKQLKGRTVCLSKDGQYVGTMAARYGALEKVYKAPADALLALRIGDCDAAVHDSLLLEALLKQPEWKKFSARLPVRAHTTLVFLVPAEDMQTAQFLREVTSEWRRTKYLAQLTDKRARSIAFEVYLDQDVPDCH